MGRILLLFILIPVTELFLLIEIGGHIGTVPTLGLIVFTGALGAWLVRLQGLAVLRKVQTETAAGRLPAEALVDGIIILIAGAVLLTPGVLTDVFGFACLVPAFRNVVKRGLRQRFESSVRGGVSTFGMDFGSARPGPSAGGFGGGREVRDVTPRGPSGEREEPSGG